MVDPVAAYDALAYQYGAISAARKPYLDAVEQIIIFRVAGARSLLDIGAGDGRRTFKIARAAGIDRVAIIEPSAAMCSRLQPGALVWQCRISEVPDSDLKFDVIICLWNVLGHLPSARERIAALAKARSLLSPIGLIFLDVNHRYNASSYGWPITLYRMGYDRLFWSDTNGDVNVRWIASGKSVQTRGHAFVDKEIVALSRAAGLVVGKRWVVSYQNGSQKKSSLLGNLLYQLYDSRRQ